MSEENNVIEPNSDSIDQVNDNDQSNISHIQNLNESKSDSNDSQQASTPIPVEPQNAASDAQPNDGADEVNTLPMVRPNDNLPHKSGMLNKLSLTSRLLFKWLYSRVIHEPSQVKEILSIPSNEPILYFINNESRIDFLYINDLCLKTGMPLAYISNGSSKRSMGTIGSRLRAFFGRKNKNASLDDVIDALKSKRPALIFLNQYGLHERDKVKFTESILSRLLDLLKESNTRVHLVPIGIIWERRAESSNRTIINEIYGTPSRPSSIRRFLSAIPGFLQVFFKIGQPQCLIHHEVLTPDTKYNSGTELRQAMIDEIDDMHQQVNGPKVKPHQQLMREILDADAFRAELRSIGQSTGQSEAELLRDARKILEKTAAKFSFVTIKILSALLIPLFALIYDGLNFDPEKLNEIRELSKKNRIIFIPSHKSHIDYLVLSVVLFQHGIIPPHIAAGENLNFAVVGSILRHGGAFFIKRSFRGEQLYTACLKHYIAKILSEGYPIEFFIEGGRSRTGQVLQPKFGILRMLAQAVQSNPDIPVKIIPCAITYEKVIEDIGYKKELEGGKKEKESIAGLIRTTKLLISKYGQLYLSFADPIDFNEALKTPPTLPAEAVDELFTKQIDNLASELMKRINEASTVTTSSLLSAAILNEHSHSLPLSEVLQSSAFFLNLLVENGARISPVLKTALAARRATLRAIPVQSQNTDTSATEINPYQTPSQIESMAQLLKDPVLHTLKLFQHNGSIHQKGNNEAFTIEIAEAGRLQMAFYKNILLFSIIDDIYFALALSVTPKDACTRNAVEKAFLEIQDLFNIEFNMIRPDQIFDNTIRHFIARNWITISEDEFIEVTPNSVMPLRMLTRAITPHIQSYKSVFDEANNVTSDVEESKFIELIMNTTKQAVSEGKLLPESRNKVMFTHAISRLTAYGTFKASYDSSAKKPTKMLSKTTEVPSIRIFDSLQT